MVNSEIGRVAGQADGALPAIASEDSRAVGFYYAREERADREVGRAVRSFQRMWLLLFCVCAMSLYLSLDQIEHDQSIKFLRNVDRVVAALNIDVAQIGAGPPLEYRDLSTFSPAPLIGFKRIGISDSGMPSSRVRAGNMAVNPSSAVIGSHQLGRLKVGLSSQPSCLAAAFSGSAKTSFAIAWHDGETNAANVAGDVIALVAFERGCEGGTPAPALLVINAGQKPLLGVPRSYGLVLSRSLSGVASDMPGLSAVSALPFTPGPQLLSNYGSVARRYIADPEAYDLYDFEAAKESLVAWAARVTGRWYSPLDYQFAVRDLLNAGMARQPIFAGDSAYLWFSRAAFAVLFALTLAMWRRIRFISRVGIPSLRSWLLVDVGDVIGLLVAALYILSVPLMVSIVYAVYSEARLGALSALAHALLAPRTYGSVILWGQETLMPHLETFWGAALCAVLCLQAFVLIACLCSMLGVAAQARRQAHRAS